MSKTFEYMVVSEDFNSAGTPFLTNQLNDVGKNGWELCGIRGQYLFFKREVE
jgi:hypothetical protein